MSLLPHWSLLPDHPKLLSFLEPTKISAYSISYDKAIYSLTTCFMTSHLVLLTLDILASFDAPHGTDSIRDLVKKSLEKINCRVILSSIRVLSNYPNTTIKKWGSDWNKWKSLCEISAEQQEQARSGLCLNTQSFYTGTSAFWMANTVGKSVWEVILQLCSVHEGISSWRLILLSESKTFYMYFILELIGI